MKFSIEQLQFAAEVGKLANALRSQQIKEAATPEQADAIKAKQPVDFVFEVLRNLKETATLIDSITVL